MRTITITFEGSGPFTVTEGDVNSGYLCWDEMLGQIAELTHPEIKSPRYSMKTEVEWQAWRDRIDGLSENLQRSAE